MTNRIRGECVQELIEGSHQAFEEIFLAYFRNIRFFICSFIKSESDSEELAQDVFMKIWENRSLIDPNQSFDAYLYVMTRNMVFNFLRRKSVENSYSDYIRSSEPEFAHDPEKILYAKEIELLIEMTIDQMPERRKEIYILSHQKGISNDEIAKTLGISKKTVENQLSLAMNELKKVVLLFLLVFILQ